MNLMEFGNSPGMHRPLVLSPPDINALFCKHIRVKIRGGQSLMSR